MIQRFIAVVLVVLVVGVSANDIWRYAEAKQQLRDATYDLAKWGADNAGNQTRDQAANAILPLAAQKGVTVYMYGQGQNSAQVYAQMEVPGTIVAGIIANMMLGDSFSVARTKPWIIKDYREAGAL